MRYLLPEFIGMFCLVFFSGLANIVFEHNSEGGPSSLVMGLVLLLFSVFSGELSRGYFNPCFTLVDCLWKNITVGATAGYLTAQLIAAFFASALLASALPYQMISGASQLELGWRRLSPNTDLFAVFSIEVVGSLLLFIGYQYFKDYKSFENQGLGPVYYGLLLAALSMASYSISGGVFNLGMVLGGIVFNATLEKKLVGLFVGNFVGALLGKLLYIQILGPKKEVNENKTLNMLLNR